MNGKPVSIEIPTKYGVFKLTVWPGARGRELIALSTSSLNLEEEVTVRIHSECLTGDVFHSLLCDCEKQKDRALREIQASGNGIFIYHRQEGRNAGLHNKVRIYQLMQEGVDTYNASATITGRADNREYSDVLRALHHLVPNRENRIKLLTNNPAKAKFLRNQGYQVVVQSFRSKSGKHNKSYLSAQQLRFKHNALLK